MVSDELVFLRMRFFNHPDINIVADVILQDLKPFSPSFF